MVPSVIGFPESAVEPAKATGNKGIIFRRGYALYSFEAVDYAIDQTGEPPAQLNLLFAQEIDRKDTALTDHVVTLYVARNADDDKRRVEAQAAECTHGQAMKRSIELSCDYRYS